MIDHAMVHPSAVRPQPRLRPDVARLFLEPSSVAIVGASASTGTAYKAGGRAVLDHLGVYGFGGEVTVVHPTAEEIEGRRAVRSLRDLTAPPDVVVIAVPAGRVRAVLEDCSAIGARQALILTAGFGDMGADGLALERSLLDYAREHGINVVGPNSTGLVAARSGLAMSMTSVLTAGKPLTVGTLAVIAQSGAIGSTVVERARDGGVGVSHIVSTGNQRDMDVPDFISYFARTPDVDAVALYLESIRDGASFRAAVEELFAAGKRLVVYLGGRTAAGEQAAASHTGKIAGRGALELALLRALGVTVVDDPDDLWVLGAAKLPAGDFPRHWGMVAYSGGMAVLATEQLSAAGVTFPELEPATAARLKEQLPEFATIPNPLDVGPGSMPEEFRGYLSAVAEDPSVGAVCVPLPMGARGWNARSVQDIVEVGQQSGKPFVVLWYGGEAVRPDVAQLRARGVLVVDSPSALGRVVRSLLGPERSLDAVSTRDTGPAHARRTATGGERALRLLGDAGLDIAPMRLAQDVDDAVAAAAELGYPVVVKSGDENIAHRTELGLVAVGLAAEEDVRRAIARMESRAGAASGGWLVQKMVGGGVELVISIRDAESLGVFGGVGVGGAAVELLRDIEHIPLPCDRATLDRALHRLKTAELVYGFRGSVGIDVDWLLKTLNRLAEIALENELAEIELNPVILDDSGGRIVDALQIG
ncbi:MAG TPA: acetate--CoA ligase family protein [Amycolatopsis sp.]|nr:acetate--CoA ligase family protein [Amycolatopsis sp.]